MSSILFTFSSTAHRIKAGCSLIVTDDQQDATFWFIYLFPIRSTCCGRCFSPSSGVHERTYIFWYSPLMLLPAGVMDEMEQEFHLIHDNSPQQLYQKM